MQISRSGQPPAGVEVTWYNGYEEMLTGAQGRPQGNTGHQRRVAVSGARGRRDRSARGGLPAAGRNRGEAGGEQAPRRDLDERETELGFLPEAMAL